MTTGVTTAPETKKTSGPKTPIETALAKISANLLGKKPNIARANGHLGTLIKHISTASTITDRSARAGEVFEGLASIKEALEAKEGKGGSKKTEAEAGLSELGKAFQTIQEKSRGSDTDSFFGEAFQKLLQVNSSNAAQAGIQVGQQVEAILAKAGSPLEMQALVGRMNRELINFRAKLASQNPKNAPASMQAIEQVQKAINRQAEAPSLTRWTSFDDLVAELTGDSPEGFQEHATMFDEAAEALEALSYKASDSAESYPRGTEQQKSLAELIHKHVKPAKTADGKGLTLKFDAKAFKDELTNLPSPGATSTPLDQFEASEIRRAAKLLRLAHREGFTMCLLTDATTNLFALDPKSLKALVEIKPSEATGTSFADLDGDGQTAAIKFVESKLVDVNERINLAAENIEEKIDALSKPHDAKSTEGYNKEVARIQKDERKALVADIKKILNGDPESGERGLNKAELEYLANITNKKLEKVQKDASGRFGGNLIAKLPSMIGKALGLSLPGVALGAVVRATLGAAFGGPFIFGFLGLILGVITQVADGGIQLPTSIAEAKEEIGKANEAIKLVLSREKGDDDPDPPEGPGGGSRTVKVHGRPPSPLSPDPVDESRTAAKVPA